ncbi:hypothetical protein FQN55_001734 [Onygenales sp. PD_40]|nr:hypothetical protein FQN55_001734 [Onygenales sp. PD_40]KAK2775500.1 hypothetical protein FQN53_003113 [Emmonsiellopsis sp. PD_33]KAK2793220.1 hypothetical protein FQN52_001868 [Onygenales sp. PD_12]KAK2806380.1 hypothetical protein FQN51_007424 [Onygenales sp. PD_10]
MAQGALKKIKPTTSSRKPNALGPKKGARVIAPKKASLVRQKKMNKKFTAGLTAKTERTLAERAGHLELLAGGKKNKDGKNGDAAGKGKKGTTG